MTDKAGIFVALLLAAIVATALDLPDWTICAGGLLIFGVIVVMASRR